MALSALKCVSAAWIGELGRHKNAVRYSQPFLFVLIASVSLFCQERPEVPRRDPLLMDVLTRVVSVGGGSQALASVRDLTESGEITFHWGQGVKGTVTIQALGSNHFRMEADLPDGKHTWVVNDGDGTRKEADRKAEPLSSENAVNLLNLAFPISHVAAALRDAETDVSLVGIEQRDGRSVYRLRLNYRSAPFRSRHTVCTLQVGITMCYCRLYAAAN